jgi:ABC-type glycerol-3-phosphate transport system substrate-binding protein
MKAIFKTAGIVLAAGTTLASCGSLSSSKSHRVHEPKPHHGWSVKVNPETKLQTLRFPHEGVATPAITKFASKDYAFYKEIINPKYWVKSKTFGQYIFVGPYTTGRNYRRVRDAKIGAVDSITTRDLSKHTQTTITRV